MRRWMEEKDEERGGKSWKDDNGRERQRTRDHPGCVPAGLEEGQVVENVAVDTRAGDLAHAEGVVSPEGERVAGLVGAMGFGLRTRK